MFNLFESRNRKITDLVKMGDYIGRSLRTNVHLFSIDGADQSVVYLSEDKQFIKGNYSITPDKFILENIEIHDAEAFTNDERFEDYQETQVARFFSDLYNDNISEANHSFQNVLSLWENRARYDNIAKKLDKKSELFNETQNIVRTQEFSNFLEILPELSKHLQEHKEQIEGIHEIHNSIKLSEAVAKAFNVSHLSYDELRDAGRFVFENTEDSSLYDIVCRQELLRKEILEAKESFDIVWATEPSIAKLASLMYASDAEVAQALSEAISEMPYLALVSKKKLHETFIHCMGDHADTFSAKDIKSYVSRIFEMKKSAKEELTQMLAENYGVNLQYIKEIPSFKSLLNTQVVIFEALSRTAPRGSVLKGVLSEMSSMLKAKNGVEAIDVNSVIQQLFEYAGYSSENLPLMETFTFDGLTIAMKDLHTLVEKHPDGDDSEDDSETCADDDKKKKAKGSSKGKGEKDTDKEDEDDSGSVQKEEVGLEEPQEDTAQAEEEEQSEVNMTDQELMAAIKELESIFSTNLDDDEVV
jgi:hypothetical protein